MDPSLRALDPDLSSDSEEEFPALTESAVASASVTVSNERVPPGKKSFFAPPKWSLSTGVTADDLVCDLLIVAACLPASAFLTNTLPHSGASGATLSLLGQLDFSARSSGALSVTLSLLSPSSTADDAPARVIFARPSGRIATESAGAVAAALLSGLPSPSSGAPAAGAPAAGASSSPRVVPKAVLVLTTLPYTAHSAGPVARPVSAAAAAAAVAASAAAATAGDGAAAAAAGARVALKSLPLERAPEHAYPPLLYSVLSPAALAALAGSLPPTAAATKDGADARADAAPFLPPSSPLFGFDAALIAEATVRTIALTALVSIDNPHHYPGEALLAFERGAALAADVAAASAGPAAGAAARGALTPQPIAFAPAGALAARLPAEGARVRAYWKWRKETEAAAPAIPLGKRDVAQHKYAKFAEKPIPHGIFA